MKALWMCLGILLATASLLVVSGRRLDSLLTPMQERLEQAELLAGAGDWESAREETRKAQAVYDKATTYLHMMLPHAELEQTQRLFSDAFTYLESERAGEYQSSNRALILHLRHLGEMERLSLMNLF